MILKKNVAYYHDPIEGATNLGYWAIFQEDISITNDYPNPVDILWIIVLLKRDGVVIRELRGYHNESKRINHEYTFK